MNASVDAAPTASRVEVDAKGAIEAVYERGWTDRIIMAFNNALLAFPGLLLALGGLALVVQHIYLGWLLQ